jgi:hypothetical protein
MDGFACTISLNWRMQIPSAAGFVAYNLMMLVEKMRRFLRLVLPAVALAIASQANAIIVTGDQGRNTDPPTGSMLTPWNLQGQFGSFLATPIADRYFITAQHIGGASTIFFQGNPYNVDPAYGSGGFVNVPSSDLRIWKISDAQSFPTHATLYSGAFGSEVGQHMFVAGRGTARGEPISLATARLYSGYSAGSPAALGARPSEDLTTTKGWGWGSQDGVQSWGENSVSGTYNFANPNTSQVEKLLYFNFDANVSPNEGAISVGDSGGGVFIEASPGNWQLAGINYLVEGPFSGTPDGAEFFASLMDMGGLYEDQGAGNPRFFFSDGVADIPSASFASSISANLPFIMGNVGTSDPIGSVIPEPTGALILMGVVTCSLRRSRRTSRR